MQIQIKSDNNVFKLSFYFPYVLNILIQFNQIKKNLKLNAVPPKFSIYMSNSSNK